MHRSWVLLPVAALVLITTRYSTTPIPARIDPVALAAATEAAHSYCTLPHRAPPRKQAVRGPVGLQIAAEPPRPGYVQPIGGLGSGPGQNPRAEVTGTLTNPGDVDSFGIPLRTGDVLSVAVSGSSGDTGYQLRLLDPRNTFVEGSAQDRSSTYPTSSPLVPEGGQQVVADFDHVAAMTGTHVLSVSGGPGDFEATVQIFRSSGDVQRIYLEFRGTTLDTTIFGTDAGGSQPRTLSPFSAFLPKWGLTEADEPRLIQAITDTVALNLRAAGPAQVVVDNSVDNPDEFGRANVSRLVIGGTQAEADMETVGIAQSVDPGNFAREETALVLLDLLSGPAEDSASLNHYIGPNSDKIAFIAKAVGDIASHEAGHFLGSWHTDPENGTHDLMDSGDLPGAYGYGPDGIGGTADDTRPVFGQDVYAPSEGSQGLENTRARTATGLGGAGALPSP
ncbi:hypothetical protein [Pseudonocardia spinosispora]|uniref:hypothetical protein n=1 Tax=Pseudonocardia spinosispora TaxID=103441 RepID=UPI000422B96E|nr:hypothetical protein [Pseudonocardia spinosispora]